MTERKPASRCLCCATGVLTVLCIGLTIGIIVLAMPYNKETQDSNTKFDGLCQTPKNESTKVTEQNVVATEIDTSEPETPGIFHDLTTAELQYLHDNLDPSLGQKMHSYDLIVPDKKEVLAYLSGKGPKPARRARIIVYRATKKPPVIEEYSVRLDKGKFETKLIDYPNRRNPVEFSSRPVSSYEIQNVITEIDKEIGDIMVESYDARLRNCGNKCFFPLPIAVQSSYVGKLGRGLWVALLYYVNYFTLFPVDLMFYITTDDLNPLKYTVKKVSYGGQMFDSIEAFKTNYNSGSIKKSKFSFPKIAKESFSTLNRRGPGPIPFPKKRQPNLVEPDGPRYSVKNKHIKYHDWEFDVRMSTFHGPQIYDVRYLKERIAYEIGLQEIVTYYYGDSPHLRVSKLVDGIFLLGASSVPLLKGIDCPETATYLTTVVSASESKENICVFEQNSGIPLRRHGIKGIVDSYLVVRSIVVLANYDYIIDFMFHQSGILETKVMSTGYIQSGVYMNSEKGYGFQIKDSLLGTLHHHLFHFKVDLDIHGTSNRYETLDIKTVNVSNADWLSPDSYQTQIKFENNLKNTELEAAYKFNFNTPKEHIVYNDAVKTEFNVSRAYKIQLMGMSKQLLPEGMHSENSAAWSRHQIVVTKHKDAEYTSTSLYAAFDDFDPVVNFTKYIADDENIVDEDLVMWLSLGLIHLPTTEDLPLTQTPGKHLSFILAPHNYFDEDPSMSSYDQN